MNAVIDHRNIPMVNNRMHSGWLLTIETVKIHYQNIYFYYHFPYVLYQVPQNI